MNTVTSHTAPEPRIQVSVVAIAKALERHWGRAWATERHAPVPKSFYNRVLHPQALAEAAVLAKAWGDEQKMVRALVRHKLHRGTGSDKARRPEFTQIEASTRKDVAAVRRMAA